MNPIVVADIAPSVDDGGWPAKRSRDELDGLLTLAASVEGMAGHTVTAGQWSRPAF